jgi:ribosomal protein S18 acetylase RimI-like enzyme
MAGFMLCTGISNGSNDGLQFSETIYSLSPCHSRTSQLTLYAHTHPTCTVFGKAETQGVDQHGHVTAVTVAPEYRRLGLARKMMGLLELVSDQIYKGVFVDLYVRCTNAVAIEMYEGLGYSVYRRVREYYGSLGLGKAAKDEEDAFGLLYSCRACLWALLTDLWHLSRYA